MHTLSAVSTRLPVPDASVMHFMITSSAISEGALPYSDT